MGLADLLGDPFGMTVQYADGTSAQAPQGAPQAAPQAQAQTYQPPHGIKAFLGMLGDAMLTAHGLPPAYQNRVNQERENAALSGFLTNPDQAIQQLMQIDPKSGIQLYGQMHAKQVDPETIQLMHAAGIDPASDEGKQFIRDKLSGGGGADPSSVREYQFAKQGGFVGSYMDFLNQRGGPLVANNGDGTFTIVPRAMVPTGGSGGGGGVTATGPGGKKIQYNPTTHSWEPMGGQTPHASGNFPGR